jgi:hypothetical protein
MYALSGSNVLKPLPPMSLIYLLVTSTHLVRFGTHLRKFLVRQIAQSIESFGFNVPTLIDDQRQVITGHGRRASPFSAAISAGIALPPASA